MGYKRENGTRTANGLGGDLKIQRALSEEIMKTAYAAYQQRARGRGQLTEREFGLIVGHTPTEKDREAAQRVFRRLGKYTDARLCDETDLEYIAKIIWGQ
ncbi:hypothetical protein HZC07_03565, partial [Candidatus Micrarchaeota archaeon]|nr:hypothetical protein [Candidatus Micrarchaeota archaeon]